MLNGKPQHLVQGENAEEKALQYLLGQGLSTVSRNFRCKQGEIDLIMRHDAALVIVEVRYRKNSKYGSAMETVTAKKQSRIIAATCHYLNTNKITDQAIRFDVVAMTGDNNLNWVKNAFQAGF
jgi:putative endonuclease